MHCPVHGRKGEETDGCSRMCELFEDIFSSTERVLITGSNRVGLVIPRMLDVFLAETYQESQ